MEKCNSNDNKWIAEFHHFLFFYSLGKCKDFSSFFFSFWLRFTLGRVWLSRGSSASASLLRNINKVRLFFCMCVYANNECILCVFVILFFTSVSFPLWGCKQMWDNFAPVYTSNTSLLYFILKHIGDYYYGMY